ncbi:HlyU family transcriptional regulator [Rhizobium sp. CC-YZS058]|uniref:HlyU family transcriptional regulator n=1 Tax=Rhizobium sp. CC-YZS058 TaxID=3042153 RepID=UPI002B057150|nr:HlyU family transcriptional regulator [Rhizobium sp. CC-YZS058]MEA3534897.1 HlyU family transcriptional regulator [Rhizobium sp. CC-YZS058]
MASFFSRLFSRSGTGDTTDTAAAGSTERYGDCLIRAAPMKEASQYRLAGAIEKEVDGALRVRSFIRADLFASLDDATEASLRKGRQIVDQTGPSLFADPEPKRQV